MYRLRRASNAACSYVKAQQSVHAECLRIPHFVLVQSFRKVYTLSIKETFMQLKIFLDS